MSHPSARSGAARSRADRQPASRPAAEARGEREPRAPDLSRAVKAALPATLEPQLATCCGAAGRRADWLVEIKFDGYRMMARIERGKARLSPAAATTGPTRCSRWPREIEAAGHRLGLARRRDRRDERAGRARLQRAAERLRQRARARRSSTSCSTLPFLDGHDLRQGAAARRAARCCAQSLEAQAGERVRFSAGLRRRRRRRCSRRRASMRPRGHHRQARATRPMCRRGPRPGSSSSARSARSS